MQDIKSFIENTTLNGLVGFLMSAGDRSRDLLDVLLNTLAPALDTWTFVDADFVGDVKLLKSFVSVRSLLEDDVIALAAKAAEVRDGRLSSRFAKGLRLFATGREIISCVTAEAMSVASFESGTQLLKAFREATTWNRPPTPPSIGGVVKYPAEEVDKYKTAFVRYTGLVTHAEHNPRFARCRASEIAGAKDMFDEIASALTSAIRYHFKAGLATVLTDVAAVYHKYDFAPEDFSTVTRAFATLTGLCRIVRTHPSRASLAASLSPKECWPRFMIRVIVEHGMGEE